MSRTKAAYAATSTSDGHGAQASQSTARDLGATPSPIPGRTRSDKGKKPETKAKPAAQKRKGHAAAKPSSGDDEEARADALVAALGSDDMDDDCRDLKKPSEAKPRVKASKANTVKVPRAAAKANAAPAVKDKPASEGKASRKKKKQKLSSKLNTATEQKGDALTAMPDRTLLEETYKLMHVCKRMLDTQGETSITRANVYPNDKFRKNLGQAAKQVFKQSLQDAVEFAGLYQKGQAQQQTDKVLNIATGNIPVGKQLLMSADEQRKEANSKVHNRKSRSKAALAAFISQCTGWRQQMSDGLVNVKGLLRDESEADVDAAIAQPGSESFTKLYRLICYREWLRMSELRQLINKKSYNDFLKVMAALGIFFRKRPKVAAEREWLIGAIDGINNKLRQRNKNAVMYSRHNIDLSTSKDLEESQSEESEEDAVAAEGPGTPGDEGDEEEDEEEQDEEEQEEEAQDEDED